MAPLLRPPKPFLAVPGPAIPNPGCRIARSFAGCQARRSASLPLLRCGSPAGVFVRCSLSSRPAFFTQSPSSSATVLLPDLLLNLVTRSTSPCPGSWRPPWSGANLPKPAPVAHAGVAQPAPTGTLQMALAPSHPITGWAGDAGRGGPCGVTARSACENLVMVAVLTAISRSSARRPWRPPPVPTCHPCGR